MPPMNEHTITAPLPENELRQLIHQAYGDDESTAMLSQVVFKKKIILLRYNKEFKFSCDYYYLFF